LHDLNSKISEPQAKRCALVVGSYVVADRLRRFQRRQRQFFLLQQLFIFKQLFVFQ